MLVELCLSHLELIASDKQGLKTTLHYLDKESPRTEASITKRSDIARSLHIEKLVKANKEAASPLR